MNEQAFGDIIGALDHDLKIFFSEDSSGHDIYHLQRVRHLALHLQGMEGGDRIVIAVAASVHDVHRLVQNKTGVYCTPEQSLPQVRRILVNKGLTQAQIESVIYCVKVHEEYDFSKAGKTVQGIEAMIVQDADNLDALGAVGIARVFAFGGAHGIPIWNPNVPIDTTSNWDEQSPQSPSQVHHFYEKLLRLKDSMNTQTAKRMAEGRHAFMQGFLQKLLQEWRGVE